MFDKNFFNNFFYLGKISIQSPEENLLTFQTSLEGLSFEEVSQRRKTYGLNVFSKKKNSYFKKIIKILFNPFNIILLFLISFSFCKDIYFAKTDGPDYSTFVVVLCILAISNVMHFIQDAKFSNVFEKLKKIVQTTATVKRLGQICRIPLEEIVIGDIVHLSAGDVIPADIKLFETKDFFVKETTFTGESDAVEKDSFCSKKYSNVLEDRRLVFMGTTVISGYAKGIVVLVGNSTYLGKINQKICCDKSISIPQQGINSIARILSTCMFIVFPLIFFLNLLKSGHEFDFWNVLSFSLSVVLGITPEMLPLIVTTSFLRGVSVLSKQKVIVKNLYSIQDFGAMNILFTDKTGTLTEDKIFVENFLDVQNVKSDKVLKYAYLNSFFQNGLKSFIDIAIIEKINQIKQDNLFFSNIEKLFTKIDEIPFDFKRRVMTVIITDNVPKCKIIISKGAIEEILNICSYMEITDVKDDTSQILQINKQKILDKTSYYNRKGFRVIGVAYKKIIYNGVYDKNIESNMIMLGFLTLLDPPKKSALEAIISLKKYNVNVKILTGDNKIVSKIIAHKVDFINQECLLGSDINKMDDNTLYQKALNIDIFAKLHPEQKARIIKVFRDKGNIVGFMGDGINDAPAMKMSNLAISVDSAADVAKESSDIILLEKDLKVLKDGVIEGRKTYINMLKYIKFTLSANFGNILSILLASLCLPFVPLRPIQILFLNLIYDLSCLVLPYDYVDVDYLSKPRSWNFRNIIFFMILFGIVTFIFDILFCLALFIQNGSLAFDNYLPAQVNLFQTSWFIFSIWTQILTIYYLKTNNFLKNFEHSVIMFFLPLIGGFFATLTPFIDVLSKVLYFQNPFANVQYTVLLFLFLIIYLGCLSIIKNLFIYKKKDLL
ncbi:MAG: magnesium-translocating P-type ATPase [Weeping tea tree witches'-broom phytoplasma]|uniref:magnesium-translocating P-type ATPase n=1 Tax=Candidatus Phytoplasma melaleucae TaxID=2982630 RepID=UPI00293A1E53|nr:magnesium-translocating P-type ATPase [Weeping tea tree witches'-broom phytoplasma]